MKKKIYRVGLDYDLGEIWLNDKMEYLDFVHSSDGHWKGEYFNFIINYFNGEIMEICYAPTDAERVKINDSDLTGEDIWPLIKNNVLKRLKKD